MKDSVKQEIQSLIEKYELKCSVEEFGDYVIWYEISAKEQLSEDFIRTFKDKIDWSYITQYQKLSESFIREFQDKVNWYNISRQQKLSENFIREFQNKVVWCYISIYQKLSEEFIREFQDNFEWIYISIYQKLSENFIREFQNKVNWIKISKYQKLSEEFRNEHNIEIPETCWLYKTGDEKLEGVHKCGLYTIEGDYVIAYKGVRRDGYSFFNFQYKYEVGGTYEAHADHNIDDQSSFGLSAWTYEEAKDYCNQMILKVRIHKDDIATLVQDELKIRATKIEILEIIETN